MFINFQTYYRARYSCKDPRGSWVWCSGPSMVYMWTWTFRTSMCFLYGLIPLPLQSNWWHDVSSHYVTFHLADPFIQRLTTSAFIGIQTYELNVPYIIYVVHSVQMTSIVFSPGRGILHFVLHNEGLFNLFGEFFLTDMRVLGQRCIDRKAFCGKMCH